MMEQPLGDVVRAFQAGSRDAFAVLVGRFQNLVTSIAFANTGDLQQSEDLAQQAFLVAWQKQDELRDPERFGGWIRSITNNLARNDRRRKENVQRHSTLALSQADDPGDPTTPEQLTSRREQNELLWATLDQIPIEYREPLVLFYREDHSVANVALQMGLSEDAVKQRLKRGRAMVKQEIEDMVEQFLVETRPTPAFASGVMAALPAIGAATGVAAVKAGGVVIAKTGTTKVVGMIATAGATGAGVGLLGGLIGLFGGVGGAWIGTRNSIKHATSEEEIKLLKSMFQLSLIFSLLFTVSVLIAVFCLDGWWGLVVTGVCQFLFFGVMITGMVRMVRKQKSLHEEHGKPEYMKRRSGDAVSTLGLRLNAIGMMAGCWLWLILFSAMGEAWVMLAISIACLTIHLVVVWLEAPTAVTVSDQIRFNARACWVMSLIQFTLITGGWLLGVRMLNVDFQGIPMGGTGLFVMAVGGGVSWMLYRKAAAIDRSSLSTP